MKRRQETENIRAVVEMKMEEKCLRGRPRLRWKDAVRKERRRERYTIIYIWRMLEGQVPCLNSLDGGAKVTSIWHIRRGRECKIPCITRHTPRNIQALKNATLPVRGQQLFNTLPRDIRNMTGLLQSGYI